MKLHSNGWERYETTLETGGEEMKLHSKRVGKNWNYTRTGGKDINLHSKHEYLPLAEGKVVDQAEIDNLMKEKLKQPESGKLTVVLDYYEAI